MVHSCFNQPQDSGWSYSFRWLGAGPGVRTLGPSTWAVPFSNLLWFSLIYYFIKERVPVLKRLSYLPVGNHSPRGSRVSIPWLWLISWESAVGSHTNRFGYSSLGLCLCACETSVDVLPAAKDSPYWDLREGPLTEITSMSDFNPCIFLVIINVVSSLAQSRVYEDHYLEWVQTEEDTDICQVLHLFQVKNMNVTPEVREFQLVKGGWAP